MRVEMMKMYECFFFGEKKRGASRRSALLLIAVAYSADYNHPLAFSEHTEVRLLQSGKLGTFLPSAIEGIP